MQIDTSNKSHLFPEDHPIVKELSEEETSLYWSAAFEASLALYRIADSSKECGSENESNPSKLPEENNQLRTAIALGDLIEEVALWRMQGIMACENPIEDSLSEDTVLETSGTDAAEVKDE